MTIEEALRTFLIADAGVLALVGTGDQIFAQGKSEGVHDTYVTYSRETTDPVDTYDGPTGTERMEIEVDAVSAPSATGVPGTADKASDLADAVQLALDGHDGAMGALSSVGANMDERSSDFDDESQTHTVSMLFVFWV